jgi:RNase H-fold protein (predicted Holliday junction resolvase)
MGAKLPAGQGFPSSEEIEAKGFPARGKKKGKKSDVILSLDLSTSCIGWAVGYEEKIVSFGKLIFTDDRCIGEKAVALAVYLSSIFKVFEPSLILIERPMDRRGNVTRLHNQMLGVVRYLAFRLLKLEVDDEHLMVPQTIKKLMGVPKGRNHDHNKQIMVEHINKTLGLGLRYHTSKFKSEDDVADAIAILLSWWIKTK